MKIPVNLNEEQIVLDVLPSEPLLNVLRRMGIFSVKCGCRDGFCGNCMVLLNGKPVPSCQIPCGIVRDNNVTTLEFFTNPKKKDSESSEDKKAKKPAVQRSSDFTEDDIQLYKDIISGFSEAEIHLCGYCNAGKIFTAYYILKNTPHPSASKVMAHIKDLNCCCTDTLSLLNGILKAAAIKEAREEKISNVQK
ncbi:MAG: 2Fe-2S iron-sulfur cluster binding domain-containing protein [Treponema sp.]|nr:2Fe-2S iron-sulfur cluster binding domain-containing protein [Treponema sp.]